jgi:hypothetical protein
MRNYDRSDERGLTGDDLFTYRLLSRIDITPDGCWQWIGFIDTAGYARLARPGKSNRAARAAWELLVGPIPDGLTIDHLCRNRGCVNPEHLEPVTMGENTYRGTSFAAINRMKTSCPHGHPYDQENTYITAGRRRCRACIREQARRRTA